ncbi:nucleotidyltransferase family protein [Kiloniella sp. b19]|uniref:nucleotidyltransferase family protein n=1 Tax=Kiloniella sp. GXU_MW_B19 TaxID=3141326 RepID=UPI0031CDE39C
MILAAGHGTRMRPLTDEMPKPLIPVLGTPMLEVILVQLARAGVEKAVVNSFYLGEQIVDYIRDREQPRTVSSPEDELLDTGGGIVRALPHLEDDPFYVMNGDMIWRDDGDPALQRLAQAWDPDRMSALLLLQPVEKAEGYTRAGDYFLQEDGRLKARGDAQTAPYVFTGLRIMTPEAFENSPEGAFSCVETFNKLIEQGRLYGLVHEGSWFDVGTPEGLSRVESSLRAQGVESLV